MKWYSGTVIRSTVGKSVPVAVTNLETSSSMKELRKMTLPNKHPKNNFEENSSWREGITIDNLQVLAIPNNKRHHLFCTTGERSPERRKEYLVTDNILSEVISGM
ncbi:hypothetical protein JTB14_011530 [Gonioctena quinquepunctata]|nr:hypothetical protein JTB14_011530 [Gonioctena quinquepunctata]